MVGFPYNSWDHNCGSEVTDRGKFRREVREQQGIAASLPQGDLLQNRALQFIGDSSSAAKHIRGWLVVVLLSVGL